MGDKNIISGSTDMTINILDKLADFIATPIGNITCFSNFVMTLMYQEK